MDRFEREYQRLNTAQRQAVDSIDGPVLVVAGPGTGKTQLLSLRVANILRKTDVQAYNILCLTYTESGKEAMINRLHDFLGKAARQVEVHTFHGFGTRLITRFPDFFPELANFRPAEDLTLYETLHSCLQRLPRNNPLSKQAYGQFTYQTDARDRISQLKRAGISPSTAIDVAGIDLAWCQTTGRKLSAIFNRVGRISSKNVPALSTELEPLFEQKTDSELGQICFSELNEALYESRQSGKTAPISSFKRSWFTSDDGKLYFKPTDQIKKLVALTELYQSYESELEKRQLYDYDDMILYALEKLKLNKEFLAQVQENFQYILADEYQDTNAAQASIINLIASNPINEGRPNVMMVGDDDQAIYGFQGALGDVLMDFRERWRDVKVITLKENYRSTSNILNTARTIITQGTQRLENNYDDIDKSLIPRAGHIDIAPSIFEAGSPEAVVDKAVQSARSADDSHQLAIIATKHKYLLELAARLDAAKIGYFYEGREDLLKDTAVLTLMQLADVILALKQKDLARTSYVLPELIAQGTLDIPRALAWQIALDSKHQKKSWWEVMQSTSDPKAQEAVRQLKQLVKTVDNKQSVDSLKAIAKSFHLRVIQKIQHLNSHALSYYDREKINLSEILRYSELCKQAGVTLDHKVVKGKQESPVVLLSAHKSKGLEFDRVYILHADYNTWFKERGRRNNLILPANWRAIEPLAANTDDKLRLLYVVMTRAKRELALIKYQLGPVIPGLEDIKTESYVSGRLEAFSVPEEVAWRDWYMPKSVREEKTLKTLLQPSLDTYHLSPTHLTMFLDIPHGGPTSVLTKILLGIPEPVHVEAVFGSIVHRVLRFAQDRLNKTSQLPSETQLTNFTKNEATYRDDIFVTDVVKVVSDFLRNSRVLQPGGVSEFSFSHQNIGLDGKRLTGTVDHYILKDNKLTIADFKTGRALNSWRITEDYYKQKLHRFRQQLLFYELLFDLSPNFNVETTSSKIVFVEPSRRDVYYELTLDASHAERRRLEDLISAVWQRIINLDLPDISSYSPDMNGITAFEDDLLTSK